MLESSPAAQASGCGVVAGHQLQLTCASTGIHWPAGAVHTFPLVADLRSSTAFPVEVQQAVHATGEVSLVPELLHSQLCAVPCPLGGHSWLRADGAGSRRAPCVALGAIATIATEPVLAR